MTVQISYKKKLNNKLVDNLIFFVNENFDISNIKKNLTSLEFSFISEMMKVNDSDKRILIFDLSSKKKIVLVSLKNDLNNFDVEKLGAKFYELFKEFKKINFILDTNSKLEKIKNYIGYFLHGLKLKSYVFEKYKTKKINVRIIGKTEIKSSFFHKKLELDKLYI